MDSFLAAFCRHLETDPERPAVHSVALTGDKLQARPWSFEDVADMAWRFACGVQARGIAPGDRVLLCMEQPQHVLAALLGGMIAGYVPVPLPAAGEMGMPQVFIQRIAAVANDCGPRLMVVEHEARWAKLTLPVRHASIESILASTDRPRPDGWMVESEASDVAFLQYTSGSTGTPRGVVVTRANLQANCIAIGQATEVGPGDAMVSWLPLHHDMGLVGGLTFPVYWHMPTYIMPPWTFVMRPASWLRAIEKFRATYSVAPNFAYSLCLNKLPERDLSDLDLSTWRLAFNGAEPIDAATVRGFTERFKPYGFRASAIYPVYGLAEATLAVAFPPCGKPPRIDSVDRNVLANMQRARPAAVGNDTIHFVSVGRAVPGHQVRIVDPASGLPCADRQVGEVMVEGPSVTPSYFGDSTQRTELKTGDLGYVAEGWLYIIDRLKDLVIVAGQNFAPSDIEACAARVPGVRKGRVVAFSHPGTSGTEELHVVAEMDARTLQRESTLCEAISQAVTRGFGLPVSSVRMVPAGTVPLTSSGKIQRQALRDRWQRGELPSGVGMARRASLLFKNLLREVVKR